MKKLLLEFSLLFALALPCSVYAAKNILVFGDSLSAGYGIPVEKSWVNLIKPELQHSHSGYRIVNISISGETTVSGRQRIAGALQKYRPSVVIIELGANDGLRGFNTADIEINLDKIIEQSKQARAQVLLIGMQLPPNYGATYTTQFRNIYPRLAKKHRVTLLPFFLEGVAAEQFQADNLHPTADAQPRIMGTVMRHLTPLLR